MATRVAVLALVCLGAFAGCATVVGPRDGGTETVTPAPVPSETAAGERLAPGVTEVGAVDAAALAAAHGETFPDGYTVRRRGFVRRSADRYARVRSTLTVAGKTFAYRFGTTADAGEATPFAAGRVTSLALWSDGERLFRRVRFPNGTERVSVLESGSVEETRELAVAAGGADVEALFGSVETDAVRTDGERTDDDPPDGDGSLVRVQGQQFADSDRFPANPADTEPRDVGLLAVLRPDGRVLQYTLTYRAAADDGVPVYRSAHVEFRDPIRATLDRPEWANATESTIQRSQGRPHSD